MSVRQIPNRLTFKFLLVGDGSVGKSAIVNRLVHNEFSINTETTIGVEFVAHIVDIDGTPVKLQIWDTAGQEKYRSVGKAYYRNAVGVLCVFSLAWHDSFLSIERWLHDVQQCCHPMAKVVIVGNKSDLTAQRQVTSEEAETFCRVRNLEYFETSALENTNIASTFELMARAVYKSVLSNEIITTIPAIENLDCPLEEDQKGSKKGCC